ncbi:snRNA-activating protein complex subunit 4 [Phlebotomus argentipes]|uniref:snRNA-activating protein complex subunit 4 n=1 Tax=Phlebotomus argentipes TaxID=94469 RepID=UPI00289314F7|nr:snRNA-activating protein complex subunit 4 [Phlebotomus argentipes]
MDISFEEDAGVLSDSDEELFEIDLGLEGGLLEEAKDLIVRHDDITSFNAIVLNKQYIRYLGMLQKKISALIELCDKRYDAIEELINSRESSAGGERKRCTKWQSAKYFGYPFFKTPAGKRAPDNEDHTERLKRRELIPMDFLYMKKRNWTLLDQKLLLDGVKSAMSNFHAGRIYKAIKVLERRRKHPGRLTKIESLMKEGRRVEEMSFSSLWVCVKDCSDFRVDWELVSLQDVKGRHKAIECEAMWRLHLSPQLKRSLWTTEEEDVLLNAVEEVGDNDWAQIAEKVEGRSEFQCFVHYQANFGISGRIEFKKKFTPEEDERLLELVERHRFGDTICWTTVGSEFETRTKHTLYKRYHYTLKPNINHGRFTPEEDCMLMAAIEQYGMNLSKIVRDVMPNRTVPQLRSRYRNSLLCVGNNNIWTQEEDEALMRYADDDNKTWAEIANILQTHNRISCRTRYITIRKFLELHPRKRIKDVPRKHRRLTTSVTRDNWKQKIVELQSKAPPKEEENKDPFKETSAFDQKFFRLLYTTFDYKFGEELQPQRPITNGLFHLARMLNFNVTRSQVDFVQENFTKVQKECLQSIAGRSLPILPAFWTNMCLPVSWSTLAAFRGIAATLALDKSSKKPSKMVSTRAPEVEEFKRRFRKMFYWTALLSRLTCRAERTERAAEDEPEASTSASDERLEFVVEYSGQEYVIKEVSSQKRSTVKTESDTSSSPKRLKHNAD